MSNEDFNVEWLASQLFLSRTQTVTVAAEGGTAPYTGTGTFTVHAGSYSYTVTDANGCSTTVSRTISEPAVLVASASASGISCYGATTSVTVSATGGTSPYTGRGTYSARAGTYTYTVTDANGCTATTNITLTEVATALTVAIPDVYALNLATDAKNTIYIGYGTASLTVNAIPAGGTAPYTYKWSNNQTTRAITLSSAGTYTVTITDAKGCQTSGSIVIKTIDVQCGNSNDKVMVCHNGKEICISSSAVQEHLSHGDKLGSCTSTSNARTSETTEVGNTVSQNVHQPEVMVKMSVYPNPSNDRFTIQLNNMNSKAEVLILSASGTTIERKQVQSNAGNQTLIFNLSNKSAGMYIVKVVTEEGVHTSKVIVQR